MSTHDTISVLADLSMAAAATRRGARSTGRYARTPNYTAPAARSSRPHTGEGVTFHFAHKALSKRNDVSDGVGTATSASAHQGYIERREAGAAVDEKGAAVLDKWAERYEQEHQGHQGDEEQESKEGAGYKAPPFTWSSDRTGFGTVGDHPQERKDFWKKVEACERRNGRVQSRIIAELPHEATPEERIHIATQFCKKLEDLGLPYWASIHAPTRKNDARNYHLHIAYSERPAKKHPEKGWDFEMVERKKKANRTVVESRPLRQNRSAEVRERGWVKKLRQHYADVSNAVLQEGGYEKRLDPRSYRECGVLKDPTKHLGFKAHAMESFGLDTQVGAQNAQKETRWRVQERTRRWERAMAVDDVAALFSTGIENEDFWHKGSSRSKDIQTGLAMAKLGAESEIMAEHMGLRFGKRKDFLEKEGSRLLAKGRGLRIASAAQDIAAIDAEKMVLDTREPDVESMVQALERQARTARRTEAEIWEKVFGKDTRAQGASFFGNTLEQADSLWDALPVAEPLAATQTVSSAPNQPQQPAAHPAQADAAPLSTKETIHPDESPAMADHNTLRLEGTGQKDVATIPVTTPQSHEEPNPTPHVDTHATHTLVFGLDPKKDQGLLLISRISNREDVQALDTALLAMTNKEARLRAIATRDMVDVLESGDLRDRANRGWVVLKAEAQRRGLDLETGRHDPQRGTDRERAERHRDEYVASVLQVRQELVHVQAR